MAHITSGYTSNFDCSKEPALLTQQGKPNHWPPVVRNNGERGVGPVAEQPHEAPAEQEPVEEWPEPPAKSALKSDWVAHVAATTELTEEQAEGLTKAQLMDVANGGELPSVGTSSSTSESKPDKSGSSVQETESSLQSPAPSADSPSSQDQASESHLSSTAPTTSGSTQTTGLSQPSQSTSSEEQETQPQESGTADTLRPSGRRLMQEARAAYEAGNYKEAKDLLNAAADADSSLNDEVNLALQAVQTASEQTPSAGGFLVQ